MAPTHQRFESDELVGEDIDLGLIVQLQLVLDHGLPEVDFQRAAGLGTRVHLLLEEAKSAPALGFRAIERQVRLDHQRIEVVLDVAGVDEAYGDVGREHLAHDA